MAPLTGAASLKKKDGTLTLSDDRKTLVWNPAAAGTSAVNIPVSIITSKRYLAPDGYSIANHRLTRSEADARFKSQSDVKGPSPTS